MSVLVDSNVLIDLIDPALSWHDWSAGQTAAILNAGGTLVINPIIYAEVSIPFLDSETTEKLLAPFDREDLPFEAAFLAGKAFQAYRRRGGVRTSPLPDFFIGAHALVAGHRLLTRDATRYRTYFPKLELIAP
jgi:predicted nucleic acid-binding protein